MKKEDLSGQVFGKLTVIAEAPRRNNRTYWMCRCECGTELEVLAYSLKNGRAKSCGCNGGRKLDLTGKRFGNLTVMYESQFRSVRKEVYWHCKCDCGNETDVRIGHLTSGRIKSCGCARLGTPNDYEIVDGVVYVTLHERNGNSDKKMMCDPDIWEKLKHYSWFDIHGYATTSNKDDELKYKEFHRIVADPADGLVADHINRNTYDNRRCNLRSVTVHANTVNRSISSLNTSGHIGVTKRENGKWQAIIGLNGKTISLGTYVNKDDAIKAREEAEEKYYKPLLEGK